MKSNVTELDRLVEEKNRAEELAGALIRLHEDLAALVHCGRFLHQILDRDEGCRLIVETLKNLGMACTIHFEEEAKAKEEIRKLARNAQKHFPSEDKRVRVYFAGVYDAGYMEVQPLEGTSTDDGRLIDLIHLFKNQLVAFLDRIYRMEEREKILSLYRAILDKLEEIVSESDFYRKTERVREGIADDTEGMFKIFDKLRGKVPEEAVHWIDEAEMRLQFADKVSQQINTLTGTLRDVLSLMHPELAVEFYDQSQVSSENVCEESVGKQQDVDELLATLGI